MTGLFCSLVWTLSITNATLGISSLPGNPVEIPVCFQGALPGAQSGQGLRGTLILDERSIPIPIQTSPSHPDTYYLLLPLRAVPPMGTVELPCRPADPAPPVFEFTEREEKFLDLTENGLPVLVYNYGMVTREGVPEDRYRSSYVHPIYGMEGELLTDDFPADHPHHRGLFWAWPGLEVNGKPVDLWHMRGIRHRFEKWLYQETGPVCALLGVQNGWYMGDTKAAEEQVEFTVYRAGRTGRAIDICIRLQATGQPLVLAGQSDLSKGYGGLNFRLPPGADRKITSIEGLLAQDSDQVPMPWVDYSQKFHQRGQFSGVSIFVDPGHPNFPPGWTIRYYGIFGVAWPGTHTVNLTPEDPKSIELRYRLWIHKGNVDEGRVREALQVFLNTKIIQP
ncbi:MAG: DUF6807 family protein [bacterium]